MAFGLTASEAPDLTTIRVAGYLGDAMAVYSKGKAVKTLVVGLLVSALVPGVAFGASPATAPVLAQATAPAAKPKTPEAAKPKVQETAVVTLRGTVEAIDKEKQTVTIKGPTANPDRSGPRPQEARGDQGGRSGGGQVLRGPGLRGEEGGHGDPRRDDSAGRGHSKPGATPAGAVGEQVTITVDHRRHRQGGADGDHQGPGGNTETVKVRDPKNLDAVKVGDLVEITYTRALAIALDKSTKK